MTITRAEKFAKMIKISLEKEEIPVIEQAIDHIIEMANSIAKVNTEGVKPLFYTVDDEYLKIQNESKEHSHSNIDDVFKNAKETHEYFFTSPVIIKKK